MTVHHGIISPSSWVAAWLPPAANASASLLDVACGGGRHLQLASTLGYQVTGIDRDISSAAALPGIEWIEADLEDANQWPLGGRRFDVVIVTNYLHRPRLPDIIAAVAPDGLLIYETFAAGNERYGRPSSPSFLLQPGELLQAVHGRLTPLAYEHVTEVDRDPVAHERPQQKRIVQRIMAVGPRHPWLSDPPVHPGGT